MDKGAVITWLLLNFDIDTISDIDISPYEPPKRCLTLADTINDPLHGAVKVEFLYNGKKWPLIFTKSFAKHFTGK